MYKFIKKYDPKIQLILKADYKFPSVLYRVFKREDEWQEEISRNATYIINKFCYVSTEDKELIVPENWKFLVDDLGSEIKFIEFIKENL